MLFGCTKPNNQKVEISKVFQLQVDTVRTFNPTKAELTKQYSKIHYGIDDYQLVDPKMIVIHHTVIPTLKQTLELFKNDHISTNRDYNHFTIN